MGSVGKINHISHFDLYKIFIVDYRNYVLSLCTMRVASRQQSETFTSFTRHLAIKAKAVSFLSDRSKI